MNVGRVPDFGEFAGGGAAPSYYISSWEGLKAGAIGVDSVNRVHFVVRIRSAIDVGLIQATLARVVARHDVLRSNIVERNSIPYLVSAPSIGATLVFHDNTLRTAMHGLKAARALVGDLVWKPFTLSENLYRAFLIKLGNDDYVFGMVLHHFVGDAISIQILYSELQAIYLALEQKQALRLPAPTMQYADYLFAMDRWTAKKAARQNMAYWLEKLSRGPSSIRHRISRRENPIVRRRVEIGIDVATSLRDISRGSGVTVFITLLAIQAVMIRALTGNEEVMIATVTSGRELPSLRDIVGRFADKTFCLVSLAGNPSFIEIVNRVRADMKMGAAHPFVRFDLLLRELAKRKIAVSAPVFNFRSAQSSGPRDANSCAWKAFSFESARGVSPLGAAANFYWLEMCSAESGLRGYLRCGSDEADRLCSVLLGIINTIAKNPAVNLTDILPGKFKSPKGKKVRRE